MPDRPSNTVSWYPLPESKLPFSIVFLFEFFRRERERWCNLCLGWGKSFGGLDSDGGLGEGKGLGFFCHVYGFDLKEKRWY